MAAWNVQIPKSSWYTAATPGIERVINAVKQHKHVAIDTETTGLDTVRCIPLYWSLAWREEDGKDERVCLRADALHLFHEAFKDPSKHWIFANAKYDVHILANVGVHIAGKLLDTQVMHSLLYEEQPHGLKEMAEELLGWKWSDFQDTFGRLKKGQSYGDVLVQCEQENLHKLVEYASNDAYGTLHVFYRLKQELEASNTWSLYPDRYATLWDLFYKVEMPFTKVLWKCERRGIMINKAYLENLREPMQKDIERIEREIFNLVGRALNPNSPVQLQKYFFDDLKLRPIKMTKGGKTGIKKPSVDGDFLEHYADDVPVAELLLKHRDLTKILGTYVEGLQAAADDHDRIHTRFGQSNVRTGRLSSADPNLQNTPRPEGDIYKMRGAFISKARHKLIVADYEALEMRLLAAASGEKDMIQIFLDGKDIHMGNAEMVFGIPYADLQLAKKIDKQIKEGLLPDTDYKKVLSGGHTVLECIESRSHIKTIGFGLNYGMKEKKLARAIKRTVDEAKALMEKYLNRYPAVSNYFEEAVKVARKTGYAFTLLGRRRFLPEVHSYNDNERFRAERQCSNLGIQGTAADAAKMAMILCDEAALDKKYGCEMLLQVHDELVFECPDETVAEAMPEIREWMEHPFPTDLSVPLTTSMGHGFSWESAK